MQSAYILTDAGLAEKLEQLEFAQCPQTEHRMIEGRDLLDGDFATARAMDSRADNAIGTLSDDVQNLVLGAWEDGQPFDCAECRDGDRQQAYAPTLKRTFLGAAAAGAAFPPFAFAAAAPCAGSGMVVVVKEGCDGGQNKML